jgi:hypothetical protein
MARSPSSFNPYPCRVADFLGGSSRPSGRSHDRGPLNDIAFYIPNLPHFFTILTVSLGATSAVVSSCGHDSGHIAHRVAQELAGHWATHEGPVQRPPHRPPPHAQPLAPVRQHHGSVRGCPRGFAPITHHPAMRDNPVVAYGRSSDLIAPSFLVMRSPDGSPLFTSSRWLLPTCDLWKLLIEQYFGHFLSERG